MGQPVVQSDQRADPRDPGRDLPVPGDLNCANTIRDAGDNIWLIDWTHCDVNPIELDFAKLENDVKFVMSKAFDLDDVPRLRLFEEFLLASRIPRTTTRFPTSFASSSGTSATARSSLRFGPSGNPVSR